MDEGLLRQRRNLMAVSVVLLLFDFAAINIEKVGFSGTELIVGRPEVLIAFAWVLWFYFLLRYYQYLMPKKREVRNKFTGAERFYVTQYAFRFGPLAGQESASLNLSKTAVFSWEIDEQKFNEETRKVETVATHSITGIHVFFAQIRAGTDTAIKTTLVTDYVFPYLLAFAAPVVSLAQVFVA